VTSVWNLGAVPADGVSPSAEASASRACDASGQQASWAVRRYDTPTGQPCPRQLRVDGTVEGAGACLGCGTCLLFGGLLD
jgi:hypothetical protein